MEEGAFENGLASFQSLFGDALGGIRDVLVAREQRRAIETEVVARARAGLPPRAQFQSASATSAPLPAQPAISTNMLLLGVAGLVAAAVLLR